MNKKTKDKLEELKKDFLEDRPSDWDKIPDIDLYKDQLTEYMKRQHIGFELECEDPLTSAMINNYIKIGVLPRANGKRYNRDHIAYLTAIALIKQVVTVQETGDLIAYAAGANDAGREGERDNEEVRAFYEEFTSLLDKELTGAAKKLEGIKDEKALQDILLELAVSSYADKILCRMLLEIIGDVE